MPTDRAQYLTSLIEAQGVHYGREDSFKLSRAGLLTGRFMLGIPLREISSARVLHLCEILGMPERCRASLRDHLEKANLVLFGLEDDGNRGVFKVYLEFWDAVRRQVRRTRSNDPLLLHLGFKWAAGGDGSDVRIARYTCFPHLSTPDILDRLKGICGDGSSPVIRSASEVIQRAAAANRSAVFLYVEAGEEGNPRRSFDVNLYKASLSVGDIDPFLFDVARHFGISPETFNRWLNQIGGLALGHISGGLDKDGFDFMTTYYETRGLEE